MKKLIFVICALVLIFAATGCSGASFESIIIVASDVVDVPVGEYTLQYSIPDYEKFNEQLNLALSVRAIDEDGATVEVRNNRNITVEADKTYTVMIVLSSTVNGEIKTAAKSFTVTAVKTDPTVGFYLNYGRTVYKLDGEEQIFTVKYGEDFDFNMVPELRDIYPANTPGLIYKSIKSKEWEIYIDGKYETLTAEHLKNITKPVRIYGVFEYETENVNVKIVFDNGEGSETETIDVPYNTTVAKPANPTREGYVFCGWYTDSEYKNIFSWSRSRSVNVNNNYVLYAKWYEINGADNSLYNFGELQTDDDGYGYYIVKPNSGAEFSGDLELPVEHNGYPVYGVISSCFNKQYGITSVTIPSIYRTLGAGAFRYCTSLRSVVYEANARATYIQNDLFRYCTALTDIVLPDGLVQINQSAFQGCTSLAEITFPETLNRINVTAFADCTALTEITLPDSVVAINTGAFKGCTNLATINIGERSCLASFPASALEGTAVTSLVLPDTFKKSNPFVGSGIDVTFYPPIPEDDEEESTD